MAQGQFTKEEAKAVGKIVEEGGYLGHLNDVLLFISAAGRAAPNESTPAT